MEKPKLSKLDSESESKSISYFQLVKHIHDSFPLFHAGGSELRLCFFRDSRRFEFTFFRKEKSEEEVGSSSSPVGAC